VSGVTKLILLFAIFLLPFQLLGVAVYFILVKSGKRNAQIAFVLVPAASFFLTFLGLFLWRYFHPGMLMLGEGAINLFILVVMAAETALHLICGSIVYFIVSHFKGTGVE
jgi:hypothetical protein